MATITVNHSGTDLNSGTLLATAINTTAQPGDTVQIGTDGTFDVGTTQLRGPASMTFQGGNRLTTIIKSQLSGAVAGQACINPNDNQTWNDFVIWANNATQQQSPFGINQNDQGFTGVTMNRVDIRAAVDGLHTTIATGKTCNLTCNFVRGFTSFDAAIFFVGTGTVTLNFCETRCNASTPDYPYPSYPVPPASGSVIGNVTRGLGNSAAGIVLRVNGGRYQAGGAAVSNTGFIVSAGIAIANSAKFSGTGLDVAAVGTTAIGCVYSTSNSTETVVAGRLAYITATTPAVAPAGNGNCCAISPDGNWIAIGTVATPFIEIRAFSSASGIGAKIADPASLPPAQVNCIAWLNDASGIICGTNTGGTSCIHGWAFSGGAFGAKWADPAVVPEGIVRGIAIDPSGSFVAIAETPTPFVGIYALGVNAFGTRSADPTDLPLAAGRSIHWHPASNASSGKLIWGGAFGSADPTTRLFVWPITAGVFGSKINPAVGPAGNVNGVKFLPNGNDIVCSHVTTPFATAYPWTGSAFGAAYAAPASLAAGNGNDLAVSADGTFVAMGTSVTTPFHWICAFTTGVGWGAKQTVPSVVPPGAGVGVSFSPLSPYSPVIAHTTTPFLTGWGDVPDVPTIGTATATGATTATLTWTDNGASESSFAIDVATDAGFVTIVQTPTAAANAVSANITGLTASTTYYFRVKSVNTFGTSVASGTASATTNAGAASGAAPSNQMSIGTGIGIGL